MQFISRFQYRPNHCRVFKPLKPNPTSKCKLVVKNIEVPDTSIQNIELDSMSIIRKNGKMKYQVYVNTEINGVQKKIKMSSKTVQKTLKIDPTTWVSLDESLQETQIYSLQHDFVKNCDEYKVSKNSKIYRK